MTGEYELVQNGWACQRCDKFSTTELPGHKGCIKGHDHIFFAGCRTIIKDIPKDRIKAVIKAAKG